MPVVAALAEIGPAILALLFMLAWYEFGNTITKMLNVDLPIIGNVIGSLVADGLNDLYAVLVYYFDHLLLPLVNFILGPLLTVENAFNAIRLALSNLYLQTSQVVTTTIPGAVAGVSDNILNEVVNLEAQLQAYASYGVNALDAPERQLADFASLVIGSAATEAHSILINATQQFEGLAEQALAAVVPDVSGLVDQINQGVARAEAYTQQAYTAATDYASALATKTEQDIAAALGTAEAFTTTALDTVAGLSITDIDTAITSSLTAIWPDISTVIPELEGVIGTGDTDILDALKRIDWTIPANLAGVAALTGVTTLTLARYLKDCGIPNCQNLSQLGKDLQSLLGLVEDASLLAFLVDLVEHPGSAAQTVNDTFGSAITTTVSGFRSLVGV